MIGKEHRFQVYHKDAPTQEDVLATLQGQWKSALAEYWSIRNSKVLLTKQDGEQRFFYILSQQPESSTQVRMTLIREDLRVFLCTRTTTQHDAGIALNYAFEYLSDPTKSGVTAANVMQEVVKVIQGNSM